jgi:hypothetical protein
MPEATVEMSLAGIGAGHSAAQGAAGELLADLKSAPELRIRQRDVPSDGSKGTATELVVSLGASGATASFVRIVKLWLTRDRRRRVTVSVQDVPGGRTVTIEGDSISIDTLTKALGSLGNSSPGKGTSDLA